MNKKEFLIALAALPKEYTPEVMHDRIMRYGVTGAVSHFCPLTAVASVIEPYSKEKMFKGGTLNWIWARDVLDIDRRLAKKIVSIADSSPSWYDWGFTRKMRRIYRQQLENRRL